MEGLLGKIKVVLLDAKKRFLELPKKTQIASIAISLCLVLVIIVLLSSGGASKKFVGTWDELNAYGEANGNVLIFANDGTGSLEEDLMSGSIKWSVEKDQLFVTASMCGVSKTTVFTYDFSGDILTLVDEDGEEYIYRKR